MDRQTKDGMACFFVGFVIVVFLVLMFNVFLDTKETYMGQIVSISVTDSYLSPPLFWGTLDTGRVVRVNHDVSIGDRHYLKETRFARWILDDLQSL